MSAPSITVRICDVTPAACSPSCVKLDKNILVSLRDNLIEFFAHEGEDSLILSVRYWLTLQSGLKCAAEECLDHTLDGDRRDLSRLVNGIFELAPQILYDKARPDVFGEVESFRMVTEFDRIDPNKIKLRLVLESYHPHSFDIFTLRLGRGVEEEIGNRLPRLSKRHVVFCVDLADDRERKFRDPILNRLNGCRSDGVGVYGDGIVKSTVEDDCWSR